MMESTTRRFTECEDCPARLVPQRAWWAAPSEERAEMADEGYACQGIGSLCRKCARKVTPSAVAA